MVFEVGRKYLMLFGVGDTLPGKHYAAAWKKLW